MLFTALTSRRHHTDPKVARLAGVAPFADCSIDDLRQIAAHADEIHLPAGQEIITQGQRGTEMMVLLTGTAVVTVEGQTIATVGAGEILGEVAITEQTPRNATVVTAEPVSLLVMHLSDARQLIETVPGVASAVADARARHA